MILCAILDSITALGSIREGLPGHYAYAWADALAPTIDYLGHDHRRTLVNRIRDHRSVVRRVALPP